MNLSLERLGKQASKYDKIFLHVFAPVMMEYVKWVIQNAKKDGVTRLYFLARDGWLMYQLAQILEERLELHIELKYIHVSRFVLRNAEYYFIGKKCIDSICVGGIDITFRKLMKRAALTEDEILIVAEEVGFAGRIDECLSYQQIQDLKVRLDAFGIRFFEFVKNHSIDFYKNITEYFESQGLTDNRTFAIVDSGWIGTTAQSISNILSYLTNKKIEVKGYYFGLYSIPHNMNKANFKSYYIKPKVDIRRKSRFSICLFETLFSSPEGMTMGYRSHSGGMVPILNENGNPNDNTMLRNEDLLMLYASYNAETGDLRLKVVEKLLSLIMGNPTLEEARIFGKLQFCDDVLELQMQNVAAVWSQEEIKKQIIFRRIKIKLLNSTEKLHESGWPEASIVNAIGINLKSALLLFNERIYKRGMYVKKAITD